MDASFVTTQGITVNNCVVKLHRLEETTAYEGPSMTRQVRRSQRLKLEREREPKSPEESEPKNKRVKGEGHQHLSEYELQRLENIKQNKAFLCFLGLPQVSEALKTKPKSSQQVIKNVKAFEVLPHRKSLRLQSKALSLSKTAAAGPGREIVASKPAKPVHVNSINVDENSRLPEGLLKLWTEDHIKEDQGLPDLKRYQAQLEMMSIDASAVAKVVTSGICSAAFHPCSTSLLIAAGDNLGHLGLWTKGADWGKDGVFLFEPHSRPISCLAFSSAQPTNLLTVSYDGSARSMDLQRALFEEVYTSVSGLKSFDFLSVDCSTLLIAHNDGDVVIVDRRTPGTSYESLHTLDPHIVHGVHMHPLERQYFVAAASRSVHVYDCRQLKRKCSSSVCTIRGHSHNISSAFFSPCTGNRMLTSCVTGTIRVFNTSRLVTDPPFITSVKKLVQVSQFKTRPKAVWDPKQEDCFVIGNIDSRPHQIQVRHESGQLLRSFQHRDLMTTSCHITAFHPNRHAVLAANRSGKLHIFSSPQ